MNQSINLADRWTRNALELLNLFHKNIFSIIVFISNLEALLGENRRGTRQQWESLLPPALRTTKILYFSLHILVLLETISYFLRFWLVVVHLTLIALSNGLNGGTGRS